jgi:hypothetical protein
MVNHRVINVIPNNPQCARLCAISGLSVVLPNSTAYVATESTYWSLQEASLAPSCIVKPQTSGDVTQIISQITGKSECQFAIKSHGHAPAAGFANIDHGVTIDMTGLNTVDISDDGLVASAGTGASWLDVYEFLDPFNKTVAGGRNGAVGVGGLTVGGGISYFSPQVGFTCDTVVNFEVVLASGKLVNANATSHSDLFHALKGGLNNFGVLTRIDFNTLPIDEILGGHLINNITYRGAVFDALAGLAGAEEYDVYASIVTTLIFNSATKAWTLLSAPIYTKPDPSPPVYQELFAVPSISSTVQLTPLHVLANESAPAQANQLFSTATYGVSAQLLGRIFDICNETFVESTIPGRVQWILGFEPLPKPFVSRGAHKNVLGTSPRDGNSMILLFSVSWSDVGSSSLVRDTVEETLCKINAIAKEMGLLRDFVYANYADVWQKPIASYGTENLEFLRNVANKYDPHGVFQSQAPGGFKLRK